MFKKILVPIDVDYTNTAAAVYQKAADLARCTGAQVRLTTVIPGFGMPIVAAHFTREALEGTQERVRAAMEKFIEAHTDDGSVSYEIRTGKNWEEIVNAADEWGADLIVVYHNRRKTINDAFSGTCTQRVTDNANCSVLRLRKVRGQG